MPLPNVLVIGAQKCGTSGLHWLLDHHPACVVGKIKESHFFVNEAPWPFGNWERGLSWYEQLYPADGPIIADVSPSYAGWPLFPGVPERASTVVPNATIVYLVRDPIDRVVAHWRHWIYRGYDRRPFENAVLDPDPLNQYIVGSSYATQLARWSNIYPAEKIVVMHQEDVRTGAQRLFEDFGLEPPKAGRAVNVSNRLRTDRTGLPRVLRRALPGRLATRPVPLPTISPQVRRALLERLEPEAEAFEAATGVKVLRREA